MRNDPATRTDPGTVIALSVSPEREDHEALQRVFDASEWVLYRADSLEEALPLASGRGIGVILCERNLRQHTWIDVLRQSAFSNDAPLVIVTSRLADEQLWAEALNLGAYDVLAKPFDRGELVRTVNLAWLRWSRRQDAPTGRRLKAMSAGG